MLYILDNVKYYVISYLYSGLVMTCSRGRRPKTKQRKRCVFFVSIFILLYFQFEIKTVFHVWAYLVYPNFTNHSVRPPELSVEYTWTTVKHTLSPISNPIGSTELSLFFLLWPPQLTMHITLAHHLMYVNQTTTPNIRKTRLTLNLTQDLLKYKFIYLNKIWARSGENNPIGSN